MSEFDHLAREWDKDKIHMERSSAIVSVLEEMVILDPSMKAMEFGAGTGILSFLLKDKLKEITLIDSSSEMIKVCKEKIAYYGTRNMEARLMDLEQADPEQTYDLIYSQMALHHVIDVETLLKKFFSYLNPGGRLAIADLYPEDGSFHGPDIEVHRGFVPEELEKSLRNIEFEKIEYRKCFEMKRESGIFYPIFLLVAKK